LSAGASGAAGGAAGVSGVAKPLGMKSPGGGVRPTEVEPKEPAKGGPRSIARYPWENHKKIVI